MAGPVFVARERELRRLGTFLDAALAGQGQVCFVSGQAGSGKTALVTEFARRAEARHLELVVAMGQGDAQTGIGDAYLPFREVLRQLTGDVDSERSRAISPENASRLRKLVTVSGRVLVELAPDLVGLFVPGAGLAMKAAMATADKAGWLGELEKLAQRPRPNEGLRSSGLDQNLVFEQYTRFVTTLAEKKPLLLILDDLQWADPSSLALLFRLGRRIGKSRIMVAGTYRPEEVALEGRGGRHPLEKVLAELKRYQGDVELSLDGEEEAERRGFVDSLLDSEPNCLDEGFRRALVRHADGQALFTVELLRAMQERGDLMRDAQGRWTVGPALDWKRLPPRVEGVIEERIGRLAQELRAALTVASVEGEEFTAEVVAQVRSMDARELVRRLSEDLQKEHRLVSAQGLQRLATRRLAVYRFQHNLFQRYLYNGLDAVERAYLHEDVGNVLEALYGEQTDEVAVQLAWHFEVAGVVDKAVRYLRRSGELAAIRYANEEAVVHFGRALALLPETDRIGRYGLLLAREDVYARLGQRDAQRQDLTELEALANGLGCEQQAEVAVRRASYGNHTKDFLASMALAQMAVELARAGGYPSLQAWGHVEWGWALWNQGSYAGAWAQFEEARAQAQAAGVRWLEAGALVGLGIVCDAQDDQTEALRFFEQALPLCRQTGDRLDECNVLNYLDWSRLNLGDYGGAWACFEQALRLAREVGSRYQEEFALFNLGHLFCLMGDYTRARGFYEQAFVIGCEIEERWFESLLLRDLADVARCLGDQAGAREYGEQALGIARELGARNVEAWALRTLGDLYQDLGNPGTARAYYEQALRLFREIGSRCHAIGSLAGLAWAALTQGDLSQAQAYATEIRAYLEADDTVVTFSRPLWIYLTCYQVLRAGDDPCAPAILAKAHRLLHDQAAGIPDEALRHSFLENVAENREIVAEFRRSQLPQ
ncbi:MAG TPA: tetratricopeptide repeat protein [Anaerolineae bacterium]|nr:tetratricopeptide repeat protein [Anaerolineae bacterium]